MLTYLFFRYVLKIRSKRLDNFFSSILPGRKEEVNS